MRLGIAAASMVGVALLVVAIRRAPESFPWGDSAATSIYTLRAARSELAVGAYSRFHWNHPGPLLYEILAPLYALSGYREISLKWTTLVLNVGAIAGLLVVVRRRAPTLGLTIALALVPLLYREQRLLFWSWIPIVPLMPFALAVGLSAAVASGGFALLPLLCAVLSFMVQTEVAFVPAAFVLLTMALGMLALRVRSGLVVVEPGRIARAAGISVAVAGVLWAVPLWHELTTAPGNLVSVARFFLQSTPEPRGWGTIFVLFANQIVGPLSPAWELTTSQEFSVVSWPVLALAGIEFPLLLVVASRAGRAKRVFEASFSVLCLALSVVGIVAVKSIVGPVSDYLVIWISVVGALSLASIAAEALFAVRPAVLAAARPWRWGILAYLVAVAVMGGTRLTSKHADEARSTIMRVLAEKLENYCRSEGIERPVLGFSMPAYVAGTGVLLQFYKQQLPIAVPDDLVYIVGDPFRSNGRERSEFYLMLEAETAIPPGATRHEWLTTLGGFRLIRLFREPAV